MKRMSTILLFAAIVWPNCNADTALWPGWMGPDRNGWVDDFVPPKAWPKKLKLAWQAEVGAGYSSPLVVGDRIYQHARQGESELLICLDRTNGQEIWKSEYPVPFRMGMGGQKHGKGPKSSPVYADGRVFTMSITGRLSAWDAESGELLWKRDYNSTFEKTKPYWGVSTSPVVDGDRVIVHFGNDDEGLLVALNAESGSEFWTNNKDAPSYSSPLIAELGGIRQVVEWNHRALVGVEIKTGQQLWEFPFPHESHNQNMPTPVIYKDRVLIGGENRGIHAVQPVRDGDQWTVKEIWHQDKLALDMSTAVINADRLYGFSHYDRGRLFCLDPETGEILWTGPPRTGENVAFLSLKDHILALLNDGQLQVIAARGDQLQTVATYRVSDGRTWAPPVLLPDGILTKDDQVLTYWSLR